MKVKDLRKLLADAPDDAPVMVMVSNHLKPGMFAFAHACECDTGMSTLGDPEDETGGGEHVFLVLPHGSGVPEEDVDDQCVPELN